MSNIGYLIELKGEYDLKQLAQAIKYVVKANDSLQLRFKPSDPDKSEPVQYIPGYEDVEVEIIEAASEEELFKKIEFQSVSCSLLRQPELRYKKYPEYFTSVFRI